MLKEVNALDTLLAFVDQFDSVAEAARRLGVSRQYLNDLVNVKKDISPNIMRQLGLKRIIVKEQRSA